MNEGFTYFLNFRYQESNKIEASQLTMPKVWPLYVGWLVLFSALLGVSGCQGNADDVMNNPVAFSNEDDGGTENNKAAITSFVRQLNGQPNFLQKTKRYHLFRSSTSTQSDKSRQRVRYRLIPGHGFMGKRSSRTEDYVGGSSQDRRLMKLSELRNKYIAKARQLGF
jgi:hypothetical protein